MRVFGLTGGIASGKSTVAKVFRSEGVPVIDADEVSRVVVEKGTEGLAAIVSAFGDGVLESDGSLDRKRLGARIFGDDDARKRLNRIVHPLVAAESAARLAKTAETGVQLACYDAALLVENGLTEAFRPLVVVAASAEMQCARLVARDGLTRGEAEARVASQSPLDAKLKAADVVVWNDSDLETLTTRARDALVTVRRYFGLI